MQDGRSPARCCNKQQCGGSGLRGLCCGTDPAVVRAYARYSSGGRANCRVVQKADRGGGRCVVFWEGFGSQDQERRSPRFKPAAGRPHDTTATPGAKEPLVCCSTRLPGFVSGRTDAPNATGSASIRRSTESASHRIESVENPRSKRSPHHVRCCVCRS